MAKKAYKKGGAKASPPSEDDVLQANATEKAGEAVGVIMLTLIEKDFNRQICTLSKTDLEWLAVAAITAWLKARAEQAKEYGKNAIEWIRKIEL